MSISMPILAKRFSRSAFILAATVLLSTTASAQDFVRLDATVKLGDKVLATPMLMAKYGARATVSVLPPMTDKQSPRVIVAVEPKREAGAVSFTATVSLESNDDKRTRREETFKGKVAVGKSVTLTSTAKKGEEVISLALAASGPSAEQLKVLGGAPK
jgi:hypothetical protein